MDLVYYPMGNDQLYILKVEEFEWIWCNILTVPAVMTNYILSKLRSDFYNISSRLVVDYSFYQVQLNQRTIG